MSDKITRTIDGLEVWNPLQYGIQGEGLKVCASEHNAGISKLQSRLAESEARVKELEKKQIPNKLIGVLQRAANNWNDSEIDDSLADILEDALF